MGISFMNFGFENSYSIISDFAMNSAGIVASLALPLAMGYLVKVFGLPVLPRCRC